MKIFKLLIISFLCTYSNYAFTQNFVSIEAGDTPADVIRKAANLRPSDAQLEWQNKELTAFIHFGINTFTNREWGDGKENPQLFNPTNLDADQWIRTLKEAGFKQVILTAKHHDGFCLWPSKYTRHTVAASPWKNGKGDVVKEVADACKKLEMDFGVYLSPWDRNTPLYGSGAAYDQYFRDQLTELLTSYGTIKEVWFDGANGEGPNGKKQEYDFDSYYRLIRKLQPSAVIAVMGPDVRWVGTETGYGRNTEWSVLPADERMLKNIADESQQDVVYAPAGNKMEEDLGSRAKIMDAKALVWYPAETDVSIRPGWFYHAEEDAKVKSPGKLLDIYINSVGKNSVLLLNIPPDKHGRIHHADSAALIGFAELRNKLFSNNLLNNARLDRSRITRYTPNHVNTDLDYFVSRDSVMILEYDTRKPITTNLIQFKERISNGQAVEKFTLEYLDNDTWKLAAEATTIGYMRIVEFKPVTASRFRVTISGRKSPEIHSVRLFYNSSPSR